MNPHENDNQGRQPAPPTPSYSSRRYDVSALGIGGQSGGPSSSWGGAFWVIRLFTHGGTKSKLYAILALAFALRLAATLAIHDPQRVPRTLAESDAPTYYVLAEHVLDGTGYRYAADQPPTAKRTPGYPLFLAGIFKIFGTNFVAVRICQAILDVVTVYLVFLLARLIARSRPVGLLAALLYALYPPGIMDTTYVMTETLYTALLVLGIVATCYAFRLRSYVLCALAGAVLALSTLTRPGAFLLPFAFLAIALLRKLGAVITYERGVGRVLGSRREGGRGMGALVGLVVLCVAFALGMLPWVMRNQRDLGRFIPTSTLMGANLYKGNDLATRGTYFWSTDSLLTTDLKARLAGASEADRDRILSQEARREILAHKRDVATLTIQKLPRLWLNLGYGRPPSRESLALAIAHLVLVALALYSILWLPPEGLALGTFPVTTIIFSTLMYLTVASEVRFVFPLIPLVLPYSALGAAGVFRSIRAQRAKP